jgi:pimeloyl-ACP methyl ester carboxylesterase
MKTFSPALVLLTAGLMAVTGCKSRPAQPQSSIASQPAKTSAAPQTTYVIVHGAWGGGWAFREVDRLLTADGNKVFRPTLTGQGERSHLASSNIDLSLHIQDVVNVILWEDLHDVVLVGHSYGGMVVTGVADRVPERIKRLVYLDAFVPENGECANEIRGKTGIDQPVKDGFVVPVWLKGNEPLPHDVPHPAKTFSEPIVLKNQEAARKIPTTYILTVESGRPPERDEFYTFYRRAIDRGWKTCIMEGGHNVQWSHPRELILLLEQPGR